SSYPGTEREHSVANALRPADGLPQRPALGVVSGRAMTTATQREQREEIGRRRVVFLLGACSRTELGVLRRWIEEHHVPTGIPHDAIRTPPTRRRRRTPVDSRLEACLAADDDPMLTPLRVAWLPGPARGGPRRRFLQLLLLGDPRDPGRMRQAVGARHAARYQVVAGHAAPASAPRQPRPRPR